MFFAYKRKEFSSSQVEGHTINQELEIYRGRILQGNRKEKGSRCFRGDAEMPKLVSVRWLCSAKWLPIRNDINRNGNKYKALEIFSGTLSIFSSLRW